VPESRTQDPEPAAFLVETLHGTVGEATEAEEGIWELRWTVSCKA